MKINIACPTTGGQKVFDFDDEKKLRIFMEMRISDEVDASPLGDEFKGYILRITGGNDKDGFPMKQGVLVNHRVRLLLKPGVVGYRRGNREGVRRRRTVRGCIVANDLSVINCIVVKKGEQEIPGLTDKVIPSRVGPKRASKLRKLFNLTYKDNVLKYVVTHKRVGKESGKEHTKRPKVQRLVTSRTLQHRRAYFALRKRRWANARKQVAEYNQLILRRARAVAAVRVHKKRSHLPPATHLHRMYMLKKAIAQKRSEKYLAKQRHLAALKWRQEHPVEKKKKTLTPEEIEAKKKRILAIRRKIWHKKALEESRIAKNTMRRFKEEKIAANKLNKKLADKYLKRSVRSALTHKAIRANAKVAKLSALLAQMPNKKAKKEKKAEKKPVEKKPVEKKPVEKKPVEKKPAEKKPAAKKATKAQAKK